MAAKVLTGNRLRDGEVVFLDAAGAWSTDIRAARLAQDSGAVEELEKQLADADRGTEVTDLYLFDAETVDGAIRPVHIRERIRALGPTVRDDLGKQAGGSAGAFPVTD